MMTTNQLPTSEFHDLQDPMFESGVSFDAINIFHIRVSMLVQGQQILLPVDVEASPREVAATVMQIFSAAILITGAVLCDVWEIGT